MQSSAGTTSNRVRRACDPCRRKKTKCTGEIPTCSFCRRLNQRCSYDDRQQRNAGIIRSSSISASGSTSSHERLQSLESHVHQIYNLLKTLNDDAFHEDTLQSLRSNDRHRYPGLSAARTVDAEDSGADLLPNRIGSFDSLSVSRACKVYTEKLHCQPLILFTEQDVRSQISQWPPHLLFNFMSITTRVSPDVVPHLTSQERKDYRRKGRSQLMLKLAENCLDVQILKSLCLLILEDIAVGDKVSAWMHIGIGARLVIATDYTKSGRMTPEWYCASWSLRVLDHLYSSSLSMVQAFPVSNELPTLPSGHPMPQLGDGRGTAQDQAHGSSNGPSSTVSVGIDLCWLRILSIWSHAMAYLQDAKENESPTIWAENGPYQKLVSKLYAFEASIGQNHRIRSVEPGEKPPYALEANRSYWASWFSMQLVYHAVQALINHPFLHISRRFRDAIFRPPSFLQRTVDQLFLHSGWVTRIIQLCHEKHFQIYDPFMAHVASIVATGYMFFLHASDEDLAEQARRGCDICFRFIKSFTPTWTHLELTLQKLELLMRSADSATSESERAPTLSVQASVLWSLFDYSSSTTPMSNRDSSVATVELNASAQFLYPLNTVQTPSLDRLDGCEPIDAELNEPNEESPVPNDLSLDNELSMFDSMLMADIHAPNLNGYPYNDFGQL